MVLGGSLWLSEDLGVFLWVMVVVIVVVLGVSRWFSVVLGGYRRILVVLGGSRWLSEDLGGS